MSHYDIIWIGTGQATGTVVPRLVKAGKSVAIVEGDRFGGSCFNYGCTPPKRSWPAHERRTWPGAAQTSA